MNNDYDSQRTKSAKMDNENDNDSDDLSLLVDEMLVRPPAARGNRVNKFTLGIKSIGSFLLTTYRLSTIDYPLSTKIALALEEDYSVPEEVVRI